MVDLVLHGGIVHDGLGSPGLRADVAVSGDRVVAVGPDLDVSAHRVIDVTGRAVAPGFVDPHTHSDLVPLMSRPQPFKLLQGVTTEIIGNCGNSAAPLTAAAVEHHRSISSSDAAGVEPRPRTFAGFLDEIERAGPTNHVAALVGHHTLRMCANDMDETLRPGALDRMRELADDAFAAGAVGLSTGLIYAPGSYAGIDELIALGMVAHRWQRPYATHLRDEGARLEEALGEAVTVARTCRLRLQVSHCKVAGQANHGAAAALLEQLRRARVDGVDVIGDQYPYVTAETFLGALLPGRAHRGGGEALRARLADPAERRALFHQAEQGRHGAPESGAWSQVEPAEVMVRAHRDHGYLGLTLAEVAERSGLTSWDALCELVRTDGAAMMVYRLMSEPDVREIMRDPLICVGSDNSIPVGLAHQRAWGCFPTVLGRYVRDLGVLALPEAIRKMTSMAATQFGLAGRGWLGPGAVADICVFDPESIGHAGTPKNPSVRPTGVEYVVLAGRVVVDDGEFTAVRAGRVLRAGWPES